ncbi:MAG: AAA family ATPase [Thermodesulfobacteriota bacterium]
MSEARGAVLAITSAKGGVGKSFFAANFAIALLRETHGRAVLVDLDLDWAGDALLPLGPAPPRRSLAEMAPLLGSLPPGMLKGYLDTHESGLQYLAAWPAPAQAAAITPELAGRALDLLAQAYDVVVVDLATGFGAFNQACLDQASHICLLLTPDVFAVNHTVLGLEALQALAFPRQSAMPPMAMRRVRK